MLKTRTFVGAIIAATAALTVLNVGPAQGALGKDKEPARAAAARDDSLAPDRAAGAKGVSSPAATSALATIQTRIAHYVGMHGTVFPAVWHDHLHSRRSTRPRPWTQQSPAGFRPIGW